jgi:hypothetical protein
VAVKHLLLVDYENIPRIDMGSLDESYRAIVFVGATQNTPRAARSMNTAHRFRRVEFQRISGLGKNALDFHIAFQLGRVFETAADTVCIVVSGDKGFDPLIAHLTSAGMQCRRAGSFAEIVPIQVAGPASFECDLCHTANTIEHNGGRWCPHCGKFATPPDPALEPSGRRKFGDQIDAPVKGFGSGQICGWCHQPLDMYGGIYDDGEWMCGACIGGREDDLV